jgi:hypothetical protein
MSILVPLFRLLYYLYYRRFGRDLHGMSQTTLRQHKDKKNKNKKKFVRAHLFKLMEQLACRLGINTGHDCPIVRIRKV